MGWFVRQRISIGGRVCVFNQYYESRICDDILKILSDKLNVKRNFYNIIEAYLNYKKIIILKLLKKNMKINLMIIEMKM